MVLPEDPGENASDKVKIKYILAVEGVRYARTPIDFTPFAEWDMKVLISYCSTDKFVTRAKEIEEKLGIKLDINYKNITAESFENAISKYLTSSEKPIEATDPADIEEYRDAWYNDPSASDAAKEISSQHPRPIVASEKQQPTRKPVKPMAEKIKTRSGKTSKLFGEDFRDTNFGADFRDTKFWEED